MVFTGYRKKKCRKRSLTFTCHIVDKYSDHLITGNVKVSFSFTIKSSLHGKSFINLNFLMEAFFTGKLIVYFSSEH